MRKKEEEIEPPVFEAQVFKEDKSCPDFLVMSNIEEENVQHLTAIECENIFI